jgi:hypothetical protein
VWFAGAHANVGGGYPDDNLSYVSLIWMIREGQKRGLLFNTRAIIDITDRANPYGKMYDSRAGIAAFYRYAPRRLDPPRDKQGSTLPYPKIHESVSRRMAEGSDSYAPLSLPNNLRVVVDNYFTLNGRIRGGGERCGNLMTFFDYQQNGGRTYEPAVTGAILPVDLPSRLELPDTFTLDLIWDTVWWRRIAYFVLVLSAIPLLLWIWRPTLPRLLAFYLTQTL